MKLIQTKDYLLLIDEEAVCKTGELYLTSIKRRVIPKTKGVIQAGDKILTYIKLSPESPDIEGLQEVKLVDEIKISNCIYEEKSKGWDEPWRSRIKEKRKDWLEGYNYNRLPFPQPTWEDVEKAFHCGRLYQGREGDTNCGTFISQLKQSKLPKEFVLGEDGEIKNGTFL